uniref:Claudin j n=1 Tax=Xiphophorus maculatus TaxID=8083 RepID=A0A3B5QSF8_XIPMA
MASMGLQMAGCALALSGWIGVLIVCGAPMWRVTAFIGNNIVTSQIMWEGIWMSCVVQSTGQMQCKVYDSMLALSNDLQGARALVVVSIVVGIVGLLIAFVGGKSRCTNCLGHPRIKARVVIGSGAIFCLSALTTVVAVAWTANTIITDFHNPRVPEVLKRELGAAIYIGFVSSGLLFCGGAVLCVTCPPEPDRFPSSGYMLAKTPTRSSYAIKNYV